MPTKVLQLPVEQISERCLGLFVCLFVCLFICCFLGEGFVFFCSFFVSCFVFILGGLFLFCLLWVFVVCK